MTASVRNAAILGLLSGSASSSIIFFVVACLFPIYLPNIAGYSLRLADFPSILRDTFTFPGCLSLLFLLLLTAPWSIGGGLVGLLIIERVLRKNYFIVASGLFGMIVALIPSLFCSYLALSIGAID